VVIARLLIFRIRTELGDFDHFGCDDVRTGKPQAKRSAEKASLSAQRTWGSIDRYASREDCGRKIPHVERVKAR
jgi:hypothetical protein